VGLLHKVRGSAELDELVSPDLADVQWDEADQLNMHCCGSPKALDETMLDFRDGPMSMFSLVQGLETSEVASRYPLMLGLVEMVDRVRWH